MFAVGLVRENAVVCWWAETVSEERLDGGRPSALLLALKSALGW